MSGEDIGRDPAADRSDRTLWRRARATDTPEDAAERFLDLAGFADGLLDPDEAERVAEVLAGDPGLAEDIAAARAGVAAVGLPEDVAARACALVGGDRSPGNVVPFPAGRSRWVLREAAGWASLAAAMVVAGWLGFTLGMDTSLFLANSGQAGEDGLLQQMLDPSPGFMRDASEGAQT